MRARPTLGQLMQNLADWLEAFFSFFLNLFPGLHDATQCNAVKSTGRSVEVGVGKVSEVTVPQRGKKGAEEVFTNYQTHQLNSLSASHTHTVVQRYPVSWLCGEQTRQTRATG